MITEIPIEKIQFVQSRAAINQLIIDEYAEVWRADPTAFPAIQIVEEHGTFWCWDGMHRTLAARQAGLARIRAEVGSGTRRDARLLAASANATHGLRRTNDDKRRAVQMLLDDPEWSSWSDREIARRCCVSNTFVSKLRPTVNVDSTVVSAERTYTRAGQTQTMNTTNIGRQQGKKIIAFYVSANQRMFADYGYGFVCIGKARTRFPGHCPAGRKGAVCGNFCQGCDHHLITDLGTYLCGHIDYQLAYGEHFCRHCGRELSLHAEAHGWSYCNGDRCRDHKQNKYALDDPDKVYPPAAHTRVPDVAPVSETEPHQDGDGEDYDNVAVCIGFSAGMVACDRNCAKCYPVVCPICDRIEDDVDARCTACTWRKTVLERSCCVHPDRVYPQQAGPATAHAAGEVFYCRDCKTITVDYPGQQCPDCTAAMNAREAARLELRARACASFAQALKNDNPNAWRILSGAVLPVLRDKEPHEMRCAIAEKVVHSHLGSDCFLSEQDVSRWFSLNNMELLQSLSSLREKQVELREWIEAHETLSEAQKRGNRVNVTGLRDAARELLQLGLITDSEFEQFREEGNVIFGLITKICSD